MFKKPKPQPPQPLYVVFLGSPSVGKTSMVTQYVQGIFVSACYSPCMIEDSYRKMIDHDGTSVFLEILDGCGDTESPFFQLYLQRAELFVCVFSVVDEGSLDQLEVIINELTRLKEDAMFIVAGNKCDLEDRTVSYEKGKAVADKYAVQYVETSAKTKTNINSLFTKLLSHKFPITIPPFVGPNFEFSSRMITDLDALFNTPTCSDLKIISDNKEIHLHSIIIGFRFSTFLDFFGKDHLFVCKTVPYDDLITLTRWIYTGIFNPADPQVLHSSIVALNLFPLLPYTSKQSNSSPAPTDPLAASTHKKPSFSLIFNEPTMSDVTLSVATTTFYGHLPILIARSPYFKAMFTGGMKESTNHKVITINDISPKSFNEILRYIYTDNLTVDENNWQELLESAFKFGIEEITSLVGQFLFDHACLDNIIDIFTIWLEYPQHLSHLMTKVKYFVGHYYPQISTSKSFMSLDDEKKAMLERMKLPGMWKYEQAVVGEGKQKENCSLQ